MGSVVVIFGLCSGHFGVISGFYFGDLGVIWAHAVIQDCGIKPANFVAEISYTDHLPH